MNMPYTHYNTNAGEWWGMERNKWGFEIQPAPKIPWLLWPLAIVGALLLAWCIDRAVDAAKARSSTLSEEEKRRINGLIGKYKSRWAVER